MAAQFPKLQIVWRNPHPVGRRSPLGTYRDRFELRHIRHPGVPLYRRARFLEHNLPAADYFRRGLRSGKKLALATRLS
jgi:hypothetical protein